MNICDQRNINQGTVDCDFELGVPGYVIFAPRDAKITATDSQRLLSFLKTQTELSDPLARFYPVSGEIKRITDESTEPTDGTLDKGFTKQLLPGRSVYLFEWPSAVCSDRNIVKLNRYNGGAFIINDQNLLIGARNEDGSMSPLPVDVAVWGGGFSGSGGDIQTIRMRVDFGNQIQLLSNAMAYRFNTRDRIDTLRGLRDIEILILSSTSTTATVKVVTGCDNVNLFGRFTTDLGDDSFAEAEAWLIDNVAPSAVMADDVAQAYTITLGSGGMQHSISLVPVNELRELGIVGFEGVPTAV